VAASSSQTDERCEITNAEAPQIWFKDLRGHWSFLAESFTNYYRMMLTHLGIISWQVGRPSEVGAQRNTHSAPESDHLLGHRC
jgi:hypothetical protein